MGCGCGSSDKSRQSEMKTETRSTVSKVRATIRRAWENTQPKQPTHVIKRINKK